MGVRIRDLVGLKLQSYYVTVFGMRGGEEAVKGEAKVSVLI